MAAMDSMIRFRAPLELKKRLKALAKKKSIRGHKAVSYADLAREALNDYTETKDRELSAK